MPYEGDTAVRTAEDVARPHGARPCARSRRPPRDVRDALCPVRGTGRARAAGRGGTRLPLGALAVRLHRARNHLLLRLRPRLRRDAGVSPRHAVLARLALLSLFSVIAAAAMYLLLSLAFGSAGNASAFAVASVALSVLFCCALSCSVSLVARSPLVATLAVLALFIASSFLNMNLGGGASSSRPTSTASPLLP